MKNAPLRSNSSIKQNFTHLVYVIVEILLCFVALHKQILIVIFFPYSFPPSSPFSRLPPLSALFPSFPLFFPYALSQSKAWRSLLPLLHPSWSIPKWVWPPLTPMHWNMFQFHKIGWFSTIGLKYILHGQFWILVHDINSMSHANNQTQMGDIRCHYISGPTFCTWNLNSDI